MAPPVTREWAIFYGSDIPVEVGGTSSKFLLVNKFGMLRGHQQVRFRFQVLVLGSTNAAFVANCRELEDAYRQPRQRFRIAQDGVNYRDYDPALNTGFDAVPEIDKVGSRADTARSRLYECRVVVRLPSDTADGLGGFLDGRGLDARLNLTYEDNRRRMVTLSGTWTALGNNKAKAQYEQEIADYASDKLTAIDSTATWQLIGPEENNINDIDTEMTFRRQYREITLEQGSGTTNVDAVVKQEVNCRRTSSGAADTFIKGQLVRPFAQYEITYSADIDINEVSADGLPGLWTGTLRAHALNQARNQLGLGPNSGAIMRESPGFDPENNRITVTMEYKALDGSLVINSSLTKTLKDETGIVLTPVTTGRAYEYDIDEGPPDRELRVEVSQRTAGTKFYEYSPPKDYILMSRSESPTITTEGTAAANITTRQKRISYVYRFAKRYKPGGGSSNQSGSGGNTTVARSGGVGGAPAVGGGAVNIGGGVKGSIGTIKNFDGDGI